MSRCVISPHMNADEFLDLLLGRRSTSTRNISRTIDQGVLRVEYETCDSNFAHVGFMVGTAAGWELGPGAIATGYLGAKLGSIFDTWTTCTRYFDVSTGTFLGTSYNQAARKCNENGLRDFRRERFEESEDWFNKAYHTCINGYSKENQFKNNRDVACIASKAKRFMNQKDYASAVSEFQRAYDLSDDEDIYSVLNNCIAKAKERQNEAASQLNQRGVELFQSWRFGEAERYFHHAFDSCTSNYNGRVLFSNNRYIAEILSEAQALLSRNDYTAALRKCLDVYSLVGSWKQDVYSQFIDHIKNKQNETASYLNQQGSLSFCEGRLAMASQNFLEAYNSCSLHCSFRNKYLNNLHVADIMLEGQAMFNRDEYASAINKFQEAYRKAEGLSTRTITNFINRVKDKQNESAANFYRQGWRLFKEHRLTEARQHFEKAYHSCANDCTSKSNYLNDLHIANIMLEAQAMFNRDEYTSAICKFQEAYRKAEDLNADVINDFINRVKYKQNESAANFYKKGLKSFKEHSLTEAKQYFKKAYNSCANDCTSKIKYLNDLSVADIMLEGQAMFNRDEHASAISKFQEAFKKTEGLNANIIIDFINRVKEKQNECAANFYKQGLKSFKEGRLTEARQHFEKAFHSCANDCASKSKYLNTRNNVNITSEAQAMFNRNELSAAVAKFEEAYKMLSDTEIKHCISAYIDKANAARAEVTWKQGKLEWDNAWTAENSNVEEAKAKFHKANCYFNKALNIKHNTKFQNWQLASRLKIEGNDLFNLGIKLFEDSQLQEALDKLREAKIRFQQGFHACQDTKFSECVNYVQSRIEYIEEKFKEMEDAKEINTAMRALVCYIPNILSHAELDKELQLEDQVHMRSNDLYLSRQVVSVRNGV